MHFDFDEDQQQIRRTARELLARHAPLAGMRAAAEGDGYDEALWQRLAGLGWAGIATPSEHGGGGLGIVEAAILLEQAGYALAATPLLGNVCAAAAIGAAGSEQQRARWLPSLADGRTRGALAVLNGRSAPNTPDAAHADVIVLIDGDGAASLLDRAAAEVVPVETIDPSRRYAHVAGAGEPLPGDVRRAIDIALVAVSAELAGVSRRALELAVAHAKQRRQFDRPIGAFQAVSHRCAEMLLATESAAAATYFAAWAADSDTTRLREAACLAKIAASDAARQVTTSAIQVLGGIGFTWEADVHWLYKRAQLDAAYLGTAKEHRARLASLLRERLAPAAAGEIQTTNGGTAR